MKHDLVRVRQLLDAQRNKNHDAELIDEVLYLAEEAREDEENRSFRNDFTPAEGDPSPPALSPEQRAELVERIIQHWTDLGMIPEMAEDALRGTGQPITSLLTWSDEDLLDAVLDDDEKEVSDASSL
jgi:hypothetical protein